MALDPGSAGYKNLLCKFFESEEHPDEVDLHSEQNLGIQGLYSAVRFFYRVGILSSTR